jgi:hypothetical protein
MRVPSASSKQGCSSTQPARSAQGDIVAGTWFSSENMKVSYKHESPPSLAAFSLSISILTIQVEIVC